MTNQQRKERNLPYWIRFEGDSGVPLWRVIDFGHENTGEGWVVAECLTEDDAERVATSMTVAVQMVGVLEDAGFGVVR